MECRRCDNACEWNGDRYVHLDTQRAACADGLGTASPAELPRREPGELPHNPRTAAWGLRGV